MLISESNQRFSEQFNVKVLIHSSLAMVENPVIEAYPFIISKTKHCLVILRFLGCNFISFIVWQIELEFLIVT